MFDFKLQGRLNIRTWLIQNNPHFSCHPRQECIDNPLNCRGINIYAFDNQHFIRSAHNSNSEPSKAASRAFFCENLEQIAPGVPEKRFGLLFQSSENTMTDYTISNFNRLICLGVNKISRPDEIVGTIDGHAVIFL